MLRESMAPLTADFVGGIKLGPLIELRRYGQGRIVMRRQLAMTLDHYEDKIPIGCSGRLGGNFLR